LGTISLLEFDIFGVEGGYEWTFTVGPHNVITFTIALTYRHAGFRDLPNVLDATQLPTAAIHFLYMKKRRTFK
jgi:hypothetical protein